MATRKKAKPAAKIEGPLYRVLTESYINGALQAPGVEVIYKGIPGTNLRPINAEAKANQKRALDIRRDKTYADEKDREADLLALSNELNEIVEYDEYEDAEKEGDDLPDAERKELEKHVIASVEATKAAAEDDTNRVTVKLQGRMEETPASLQGATPITDKGGKK